MTVGIRARVVLLALLFALPLLAVDLYEAGQAEQASIQRGQQEALLLARSGAALLDDILDDTRYLLAGFAAALEDPHAGLTGPGCEGRLRRLLESSALHVNMVVAAPAGDLVCAARPLGQVINVSDRKYFQNALAEKTFILSDVIISRDSGMPVLVAARPVFEGSGDARAVVLATLKLESLGEALQRTGTRAYVTTYLVNSEGMVLARWPHEPQLVGRKLVALGAALQGGTVTDGIADVHGSDGVRRVSAYARLRDVGKDARYVVAGIPRDALEQGPRAMLRHDLGMLAATLAIALALGFLGAHLLVVKPIRRLRSATDRYRHGDFAARSGVKHGGDEIGQLAASFDVLAEQNQRVTRALKALSGGNRTLLREKDESALLGAMCRVAVERAGYRLALVNYAQRDTTKSVHTVAKFGHDEGFVAALELTWEDSERGRGTVGSAIRNGRPDVIRSLNRDPRFLPWRESSKNHGFGSVASFPLRLEGAILGTLTLYAAEEDAFDSAEMELLDEMAADLAFGIQVLRANARRIAAEAELQRAITHDALTGLPGRMPFLHRLRESMQVAAEHKREVAVVVINLPNLQDLHDSFGYEAANAAVMESASRLKFAMAPATELARLTSDDFALLLPNAGGQVLVDLVARLHALLESPVSVGSVPVGVRSAFGASLYPQNGEDGEILLRRAAIAARESAQREIPFHLYSGASERESPERLALAAELRTAIEERRLALHFQPKVDIKSGALRGFEALVRWPHAQKGMIPPLQFVGIAERTGLIRPLTSLVLDLAIKQLAQWRQRSEQLPIAVNLSPRNLHDPGLFAQIADGLAASEVPAALLELEITESALAEDPQAARELLGRLRALGCKLYIDDFGTGYSSLSHLVALPLDALKIDRSFVRQMSSSPEARSVTASIILMAHQLGLRTVAEGVETEEDVAALRDLGCDDAQGYFFGRPVPPDAL